YAIANPWACWNNGIVPYVIDSSLENVKHLITKAMDHISQATGGCVCFAERQTESDYVIFFNGDGCYSYVGRIGGAQFVSLNTRCHNLGVIIHELCHVLGFYHEQNRYDRDDYLIIHWENIQEGEESQFALLPPTVNTVDDAFSIESITIYGNYVFSKDGVSKTMEAKSGEVLIDPYYKDGLSASDISRIKALYGCA
ncbi:astacin-like metalloprotease toxin 5, partial [Centruroides vittatus]|uniref:astacin-like metalloprotease toxin 5 n=1 Tax=Centruroides vittatus TaxID=120091 RepID=UPI00350F0390